MTKAELQVKHGCTRKQAVKFNKNLTNSKEIAQELERVKREFPRGGKRKQEKQETKVA